jgi:hypothetical protein
MFNLNPAVATVIAQIACHDNALPQGSPASPVISNLIGNILDSRLLALAMKSNCTYTRYADDITFSTNEKSFSPHVAVESTKGVWEPSKILASEIRRAGFAINNQKTRMTLCQSRQVVTGLVVNKKVNIDSDYYRFARAMCHSLFYCGKYYRPNPPEDGDIEYIENLNPLEGILSHIYFVKERRDRKHNTNRKAVERSEFLPPKAPKELYRKFLFFKHFVMAERPLIVTEGVSDIIYLKCAIRALASKFPSFIRKAGSKPELLVNFLKPTGNTRDVLNLGYGSSGQAHLIERYNKQLKKFTYKPLAAPVIILCDNDDGPAKTIFTKAKSKCGVTISKTTTDAFYHLGENLYVVKVPEDSPAGPRDIEDLFPEEWLKETIDGKPFDKNKDHGDDTAYGKVRFAEKIVRPNRDKINFDNFEELLLRIQGCVDHYKILSSSGAASKATVSVGSA